MSRRIRRTAFQLLFLYLLVSAAIIGVRVLHAAGYNAAIRRGFDASKYRMPSFYQEHRPMEELKWESYRVNWSVPAFGYDIPPLHLKQDLHYYRQPSTDSPPALTIPEGTEVSLSFLDYKPGTGVCTYPTYEKGWRYGVPITGSAQARTLDFDTEPRYYVRLEDLQSVMHDGFQEYWDFHRQLARENEREGAEVYSASLCEKLSQPRKSAVDLFSHSLFLCDEFLYRYNCYLSPDLLLPLWDGWDTALSLLCGVCVVWILADKRKEKRKYRFEIMDQALGQPDTGQP